jgi:hypothetical protein
MKQPQVQEQLQINQQQHRNQYQHLQQQQTQQQIQAQQQQQQQHQHHQKMLQMQQQQTNLQMAQQQQQGQQTVVAAQPAKTISPEPKRVEAKFKSGFLAVCPSCGYSGYNFAACDRCNRIFPEEPRAVQIQQQPQMHAAGQHKTTIAVANKMTFDKLQKTENEKKQIEILQKKYQQEVAGRVRATTGGPTTSARGGRQPANATRPVRARGTRAKEAEPVILTLSSDEEDDDSKQTFNSQKSDDKVCARETRNLFILLISFFIHSRTSRLRTKQHMRLWPRSPWCPKPMWNPVVSRFIRSNTV